jgi:CBS-domain-containing membrane protein
LGHATGISAALGTWVHPEDALARAMVRIQESGTRRLLVLTKEERSLVGLLTPSDIVRAQAKVVADAAGETVATLAPAARA